MKKITVANSGAGVGIDKNNCSVRALANCTGINYDVWHRKFAEEGRKDGKGTPWEVNHKVFIEAGLKLVGVYGSTATARWLAKVLAVEAGPGMTLENALKRCGKDKRYILGYKGHVLAVVNGEVIDSFPSPAGKRLLSVYVLKGQPVHPYLHRVTVDKPVESVTI